MGRKEGEKISNFKCYMPCSLPLTLRGSAWGWGLGLGKGKGGEDKKIEI